MGGGPTITTTEQKPGQFDIPPELKPLIDNSVQTALGLQFQDPLTGFVGPNPQGIPGLDSLQQALIGQRIGFSQRPSITGPELSSLNLTSALAGGLLPTALGQRPFLNPLEAIGAGFTAGGTALSPAEQQSLRLAGQSTGLSQAEQQGLRLAGQSTGLSQAEQQGLGLAGRSAMLAPGELDAMMMARQTAGQNPAEGLAIGVGQGLSSGQPNAQQQLADRLVRQGVPLHEAERAAFQQLRGSYAGGQMSAAEQQALNQLGMFTRGELGQAPATLAAQRAFRQFEEPGIMQELSLAGLGNSGAVGAALAEGESRSMVPFLTQEMANRLQATGMGANIGQTAMARGLQATGMEAELGRAAQARALEGAQMMAGIGGDIGRLGLGAGELLAQVGQGQGLRGLQAAGLIGGLGSQAAGRGLTAAQLMSGVGEAEQARGLQAAQLMSGVGQTEQERALRAAQLMGGIGETEQARGLQAGQQFAALGQQAGARPFQAAQAIAPLAGMQASLGQTLAERARTDTLNALVSAGMPREVAAQQAQAEYNEFLRRQALSEAVTLGPLGQMLPSALMRGQISTTQRGGGGILGKSILLPWLIPLVLSMMSYIV